MVKYRVYRMKDATRQQFRWAPHVSGAASVKPKDYQPGGEIEAEGEYDAWSRLRASEQPLEVGDVLESESGELRIYKYVGFEAAAWVLPEAKSPPEAVQGPAGQSAEI